MANANENKEMELPRSLRFTNVMLGVGNPIINPFTMALIIQYNINCYRAAKIKPRGMPTRKISITNYLRGESCAHIDQRLAKYSVSASMWSIGPFAVEGDDIVLYYDLLVPTRQAWMADVILRWFAGDAYVVTSPPVVDAKRGSSAVYAANSVPWIPKGSPPKSRNLDMTVTGFLFSAVHGQSRFSKQVQQEIDKMRAAAGKPISKDVQTKSQPAKRKPIKRKKKQNKIIEFLKS